MSSNAIDVFAAALSLPCRERAELAERLLLSLDEDLASGTPPGASAQDIQDRMAAVERGEYRAEDAKSVLKRMRRALDEFRQDRHQ